MGRYQDADDQCGGHIGPGTPLEEHGTDQTPMEVNSEPQSRLMLHGKGENGSIVH